jgi:hypothetical protein
VADLTTTNVLLGILAGVALLQLAGLIVGAVQARRAYQRGVERIESLERHVEHTLAPFAARAQVILERADRVSERVDQGTEKLDRALAVTSHGAQIALTAVNGNVQRTAAFAAALATGGRAAIRAWRASRGRHRRDLVASNGAAVPAAIEPQVESPPRGQSDALAETDAPYVNHRRTEESHVSI